MILDNCDAHSLCPLLRDDVHASVLGETLDHGLQKGGYFPNVIRYYGNQNPDMAALLVEAAENSRGKLLSFDLILCG